MTFAAFQEYVTDTLASLVKICIQHRMRSKRAIHVMRWARTKSSMIWDSFEADEPIQDVADALYRMAGKEA